MSIEITHISKCFDNVKALDNINFKMKQGEFISILGPSGCGKTTLLRLIAGFDYPTDGEIKIDGELVTNASKGTAPEKRNLGMVFQSFALWPHMTVKQHIEFPIKYHSFVTDELKNNKDKLIDEILAITGLKDLSDRLPSQLSGGQKQRVAIARAIAVKPALLLMDEPLSALDAELREEMRTEIQSIHKITKASIIYVTHDQSEALAMSDRIIIMKNGKIQQIGTPEEIYLKPENEFVATFVSKASLIKGIWENNMFHIKLKDKVITWKDYGICESLKNKGLFPVRPEQLKLSNIEEGIPSIVRNVQYLGKSINYTLEALGQLINVNAIVVKKFEIGDSVNIVFNE